jgi:undecaprenyl diphosphate synthase
MDSNKRIPKHVSIIMDGNGRWATARGMSRSRGHIEGVESIRACLSAAIDSGVEYLSLYAFSEENWNRSEEEVMGLMELLFTEMKAELQLFLQNKARFLVLGNRPRLSDKINQAIDEMQEATSKDYRITFILFFSYSGRWDILQAMKKAARELTPEQFQALEQKDFDQYLVTAGIPDPDLIIRTSGELRISNYLLWQGAYSEFYFTDILWPEFRQEQFEKALEAYASRDRRYGKVK